MAIKRHFSPAIMGDNGTLGRRQFLIGAGGQRADNGN